MSTDRPGGRPAPARTPNRPLAALIAEAGFSNAGLARRVDQLGLEHGLDLRYDKTSVTRWLRGQQPRGTTPALIAEVFTRRLGRRLTAQDLGLDACAPVYAGLEFAANPSEAIAIVAGLWRKDTGNQAELRKIAFTSAGLVVPSRDWLIGRPDEKVGTGQDTPHDPHPYTGTGTTPAPPGGQGARPEHGQPGQDSGHHHTSQTGQGRRLGARGPLGNGPTGARELGATSSSRPHAPYAPPALSPAGGPAARVPAQGRGPAPTGRAEPYPLHERVPGEPVTSGDVAALRSVAELFRALDEAHGGGHARPALVRYLEHEVEPMLRGRYGERTGRRLFAVTAELTRLAGWTAYDIAAHGLAQRYFVQALRQAQVAADRAYGGFVLVTMSRQAVHLGHGREAVQLARVAQQGVGTSAPRIVQASLHAAEARGHAVLEEERATDAALGRAEQMMAAASPGEEVPPWARHFDDALLAADFAHASLDLRRYRYAATHAERAVRLCGDNRARVRLLCQVTQAVAQLGLGRVEQACVLGLEAARGAARLRSACVLEAVRAFEALLEPYRDTATVRGYRDRVAALG